VVIFDTRQYEERDDVQIQVSKTSPIEEVDGKLDKNEDSDKLMSSVLENDKETIEDGKLIMESINRGVGSFTPDLMMQSIVKNYSLAKQLYGERIIRILTGYSSDYVEKNRKIPEFKRELKRNIEENTQNLKEKKLLNNDNTVSEMGLTLSSIVLYVDELNNIISKGLGEKHKKQKDLYGDREDYKKYQKSRYKDIAIRQSVKTAIRRIHKNLTKEDLKIFERKSKGKISIIYGLDSSGSMKGEKLAIAKKAGVALAFKAIQEKNKVGLIVFGSQIKESVEPTTDFMHILKKLSMIKASMETDIKKTIEKAIDMFPKRKETKHLILLTDAVPTKGTNPEEETLKAVSAARNEGITISLIGIGLDSKGLKLAKKITEIGNGRIYKVTDLKNVDTMILEDYDSL